VIPNPFLSGQHGSPAVRNRRHDAAMHERDVVQAEIECGKRLVQLADEPLEIGGLDAGVIR
jgi:hypothetical protein